MSKAKTIDLPIIGVVPARLATDPMIQDLQRLVGSIQICNGMACWDHMAMFALRDKIVEARTHQFTTNLRTTYA